MRLSSEQTCTRLYFMLFKLGLLRGFRSKCSRLQTDFLFIVTGRERYVLFLGTVILQVAGTNFFPVNSAELTENSRKSGFSLFALNFIHHEV